MHEIEIKAPNIHYKLNIEYRVTILMGLSATGKTTLTETITDNSGAVEIKSDLALVILNDSLTLQNCQAIIDSSKNTLFIVDETAPFLHTSGFENVITNSDNYFILITRDCKFGGLPIARDAFVQLKTVNGIHSFSPVFTQPINNRSVDYIYTEDSNSGFKFIKQFFDNADTVRGKGNFKRFKYKDCETVGLVYDAIGIGFTMFDVDTLLRQSRFVDMSWPSFEGYVLSASCVNVTWQTDASANMEKYLVRVLRSELPRYSKDTLHPCLCKDACSRCKVRCYMRHGNTDMLYDNLIQLRQDSIRTGGIEKPEGYTQEVWDMLSTEEKEEILRMIDSMKGNG